MKKNDVVLLVMDNPFFHQMLGLVKEPHEWGAAVEVESHDYPNRKRWELRATTSEMIYIGTLANIPEIPKMEESVDGGKKVMSNAQAVHKYITVPDVLKPIYPLSYYTPEELQQLKEQLKNVPAGKIVSMKDGFTIHTPTGDIQNGLHDPNVYSLDECPTCGQMKLRRVGPCEVCDACGSSTGC